VARKSKFNKETIEGSGGRINKFLGDGFFAYWRDHEQIEMAIDAALKVLKRMQEQARPPFRFALHLGRVTIGGVSVGEEERISGREVHYVFRMEKLARDLNVTRLISEGAWGRLAPLVEAQELGHHSLHGFEGQFPFYTV